MNAGFVDALRRHLQVQSPIFPVFFPVIRKFAFGDSFECDCVRSQAVKSLRLSRMSAGDARDSAPLTGRDAVSVSRNRPNASFRPPRLWWLFLVSRFWEP